MVYFCSAKNTPTNMKKSFSAFRKIAFIEGVSYVILLINMLLIKKFNPELGNSLVYPIGMLHGVLFIAYFILALLVKFQFKRSWLWFFIAGLVSIIPLGTFFMEGKWKKEEAALNEIPAGSL